jgi:hypothetical protein
LLSDFICTNLSVQANCPQEVFLCALLERGPLSHALSLLIPFTAYKQ